MKKYGFALLFAVSLIAGCAGTGRKPDAPLQTEGEITPPPGCVELRQRGGAC